MLAQACRVDRRVDEQADAHGRIYRELHDIYTCKYIGGYAVSSNVSSSCRVHFFCGLHSVHIIIIPVILVLA